METIQIGTRALVDFRIEHADSVRYSPRFEMIRAEKEIVSFGGCDGQRVPIVEHDGKLFPAQVLRIIR